MLRAVTIVFFFVILCSAASLTRPASAITAELAKKCRALATKTYPTALPGSKVGNAKAQRDFYVRCLDGKVDSSGDQHAQPK
jgi:hypothetical protein